jgi:hypothetical protein
VTLVVGSYNHVNRGEETPHADNSYPPIGDTHRKVILKVSQNFMIWEGGLAKILTIYKVWRYKWCPNQREVVDFWLKDDYIKPNFITTR